MLDEQTRRSIWTMCLCDLDIEGLKGCFPKIEESVLIEVYKSVKNNNDNNDENEHSGISCNCS